MPAPERLPLQATLYVAIHLLSIFGGAVAIFLCTPAIAALWIIGLGVTNAVLIRLPPRWFGDKPEADSANP